MKPLIRDYRPEDLNFILATWLNSYYESMCDFRPRKNSFYKHHEELIKLKLPQCTVKVMCNSEDPDQVMGYIVTEGEVLHYLYVKSLFRGYGFAKALLEQNPTTASSHITKQLWHVIKEPNYNPYLFR